ncbi:hypothetical protein GCM10010277_81750 [Streptomyces longisporoflavus]|uniref:asparagine synthase-related protein n=1 Tax=Streptomyces longisporoflavus TaxID=28044 RepID=UPI0019848FB7|nr:asparagine synthase-related protein [Streptomyces longisporoflavus]GGV70600.1 hypothetical protein GCM10010277_81750 [Streptomyces longisporoflavus]
MADGNARHRFVKGAGLAELAAVPAWFVALPDCAAAAAAGARLSEYAQYGIPHPSGRPWLLGAGRDGLALGEGREAKVAVFGQHAVTGDDLDRIAGRIAVGAEAGAYAERLAGSFHLVASAGGQVRVQGALSGLRRVYTAEVDGMTVAADRADVLAFLAGSQAGGGGAAIDRTQLAFHLLDPPLLHPLTDRPVWGGVTLVSPDHCVLLDRGGRARTLPRWTPPPPDLPLAEGARAVREALEAAVAVRTAGQQLVSGDLSGLDSTSVCCLAAGRTRVVAFTAASPDPLDDDVEWAVRTAAAAGGIEHHVVPAAEMPSIYHGLPGMDEPFDEPCGVIADSARWLSLARRAAAHGSTVHLTGFGGDELLGASTSHLRTLLRRRPLEAVRQLRGFTASYRWSRRQVLRQLCDTRSYGHWLDAAAGLLTAPAPFENAPTLDWGPVPRMPPWATGDATDAVRALIRDAAPDAELLADRRGIHDDLEGIRDAARPLRAIGQLAARTGIRLAAPYYDDRVLEAALAVRPEEKRTPWRYKPLLLEGMKGAVPDVSLARQSKSPGTCDLDGALRKHRAELLALWEDSRLARLGLADPAALRTLCARPLAEYGRDLHGALYQAVACEVWLRARERAATTPDPEAKSPC